jgi:hypothetical protein
VKRQTSNLKGTTKKDIKAIVPPHDVLVLLLSTTKG